MGPPVDSWRWQAELLGVTVLGGLMGVSALVVGAPYWLCVAWRERDSVRGP